MKYDFKEQVKLFNTVTSIFAYIQNKIFVLLNMFIDYYIGNVPAYRCKLNLIVDQYYLSKCQL